MKLSVDPSSRRGSNTSADLNDGLGTTFNRPSKDEFSSKGGSYIKLGNHKSNAASPSKRAYNSTFMTHIKRNQSEVGDLMTMSSHGRLKLDMSTNAVLENESGLQTTKFHAGFQRREEKNISNPAADTIRRIQNESQERRNLANAQRSVTLYQVSNKNGFNVITGAPKPGVTPVAESPGGKRRITPVVSDEIAANSRIMLRESGTGRFFMPHATGVKHEYRQEILQTQGVTKPFTSAILAPGNADLASAGIEDNFSRSQYPESQPEQNYKRLDLPMMREPGKYTPRKQVANPSGNGELVKSWGSGIDISNKALRGEV